MRVSHLITGAAIAATLLPTLAAARRWQEVPNAVEYCGAAPSRSFSYDPTYGDEAKSAAAFAQKQFCTVAGK